MGNIYRSSAKVRLPPRSRLAVFSRDVCFFLIIITLYNYVDTFHYLYKFFNDCVDKIYVINGVFQMWVNA